MGVQFCPRDKFTGIKFPSGQNTMIPGLKDRKSDGKKGALLKRPPKRNGREKGMDCKLDLSKEYGIV